MIFIFFIVIGILYIKGPNAFIIKYKVLDHYNDAVSETKRYLRIKN